MMVCEKCVGNQYNGGGGESCQACLENEMANEAKSSCTPCPAGEHRLVNMAPCEKCPDNQYSGGGGEPCQECSENKVANDAKSGCSPCPVGEYRLVNMTMCKKCEGNQFNEGGGDYCKPCPANEIANEAKSACVPCGACDPGYGVSTRCDSSQGHQTACEKCLAGEFSLGGTNVCEKCYPGEHCPIGSSFRKPCSKGSYCPTFSEQVMCTSGVYCPRNQTKPLECVAGAKCILPASPELVLVPDLFDVTESEVVDNSGHFVYSVSLSAKPTRPVTVRVRAEVRKTECYKHGDKFLLNQRSLFFDADNFSTPQNTTVSVNRLDSTRYEGTFIASFHHSVETEDEDFQLTFVRPVSVTLQDDSPCKKNAQKYEDGRIRKCGCTEGTYIKAVDPLFCDSVIECSECPEGMMCNFQQNITEAVLDEHFYRMDNDSVSVVKCPEPSTQCIGKATSGDSLCTEGHTGPLCMVCILNADARYVWGSTECEKCEDVTRMTLYWVLAAAAFACIAIIVSLLFKPSSRRRSNFINYQRLEIFGGKVQTKYKILVTFTQVMSTVATLYPLDLPDLFKSFWSHFRFLSIDLRLLPINCIMDTNFHDRLVATTCAPIVFVSGIVFLWFFLRQRLRWRENSDGLELAVATLTAKAVRVCVIFLFTVFPLVSTTIFQTFQYDERLGEGHEYLIADYTIERGDTAHSWHVKFAMSMACLYCFGIPAVSLWFLRSKKKSIQKLQLLSETLANLEDEGHVKASHRSGSILSNRFASARRIKEQKHMIVGSLLSDAVKERIHINTSNVGVAEDDLTARISRSDLLKMIDSMKRNDPW